jgi:hypothetical protein
MSNEPSGEYYDYTKTMKPERPFLLPYDQSLTYLMMICTRDGEGKLDKLYRTFEDTLAAVRKVSELTCGIPQIIYLVGWHHEGHDSKYPDWSEVNRHLKRDCDKTALESLQWLIREGRKYNATISLHLNMMDAYTESPLWDEYVQKDIIAKDVDGNIIKGKEWGGMVSYQMSYTQEWKTGMAQKRIDGIIEMIPELVEGKTIHIDAFLGARPEGKDEPISPFLGYSKAEELVTQRRIFRYWRDRGIDVTSEWVNGYRDGDRMVGLQAWAWHLGGDSIDDLPTSLYCTNPMEDARHLDGSGDEIPAKYLEEFCLILMPWHYKNNPETSVDPQSMIDGGDSCIPALWCEGKTLIAYSRDGYESKTWQLPVDWQGVEKVTLATLTTEGAKATGDVDVVDGKLTLSLGKDQAVKICPVCC